jgi:transcriptional regulator with XRE-family HTH domain
MPKSVKENLSQLVKRVVQEKKLKLRQVEQKSGGKIARSYVSRIMTGDVRNITLDKLVALAHGLELDPHILFTAYYGRPPSSTDESQEVLEWGAVEFVEMMREVVGNPKLTEIVRAATKLWPEEYETVLTYLTELNERKRKSKGKKLPNGKATT